ncbi:MAG: DNA alkylation repair protein [Ignavibacteriaceae bacterium]|nr:DNA alkylation repair protein [Ignavibacteriaceae bacterium]
MTETEVLALIEQNKNERGIKHWEKNPYKGNLLSHGLGITQIKNIAKKIKKNHDLALELWKSDYFEAKFLATLIEEPKKVTREQVEHQVPELGFWMLANGYVSNLLSALSFADELSDRWRKSDDHIRRRCGYLLLYGAGKSFASRNEDFYLEIISDIENKLQGEENFVKDAMNNALYGIGRINKNLNARVIEAAKKIGKISVDYGDNSCEPLDILKHLTNERIQNSLS